MWLCLLLKLGLPEQAVGWFPLRFGLVVEDKPTEFSCKRARILQYGTGSSIAIIGFAIWPDLTTTQLLNYAIKTCPTV